MALLIGCVPKNIVFAKTYPEKREFLSLYYLCHPVDGEAQAGEKFVEIKWIKPGDVQNYFTTSLHVMGTHHR